MFNGLINLPWWGYVLVTLAMTHITIVSVTIFLHRHQTHRALDLHPAVAHFFRFWLFLTSGIVTKQWVAVHRKHHAHVETEDDPHSPQFLGLKKVLWTGAEVHADAYKKHPEILDAYGHGTPDDWLERCLYSRVYGTWLGILLLKLTYIACFGAIGITMWAIHMMWLPFFAGGVINGVTHYWGYRNHACPDASTNLIPWGILIGGEELHNNHHAFPGSAKFSVRAWEFDIGWLYIRVLCALGLARVKKIAPRLYRDPKKSSIDEGTAQAVTTHRLRVLSDYRKQVLECVYKEEFRHQGPRPPLEPFEALLKQSRILRNKNARGRLAQRLRHSPVFARAYRFHTRLHAIAQQSSGTSEQGLGDLQEWYQQAKTSGIKPLEEFAKTLPIYTLRRAR